MLPLLLSLKNFTSYINETIDFREIQSPTIICGDNGNGKSSIIDAITTALYFRARGTDTRGAGMDDLITKGKKEFTVDFIFELDGKKYQIIRSKSKSGSHKLELYIDGMNQTSSIKETQQQILDAIKIDYDTFVDTVCIAQNHASSFMEKTPDKRKDVFVQILNLNEYDDLEKFTKDLKKQLNGKVELKKQRIEELQVYLDKENEYTQQVDDLYQKLKSIDINQYDIELESLQNKQSTRTAILAKNDLIISQRRMLTASISRYEQKYESAKSELSSIVYVDVSKDELVEKSNELEEVVKNIDELKKEKDKYEVQLNIYKKELSTIKEKIINFEKYHQATCEFCGNELTDEYKEKHIAELKSAGNEIFNSAKQYKEKVDSLNEKNDQLRNKYKELYSSIEELKKAIHKNELQEVKKSNLEQTISESTTELTNLKSELEENMLQKVEEVEDDVQDKINRLKYKKKELEEQYEHYKSSIAILKDRLKTIEKLKDEYINLKNTMDDDLEKLEDYKSLIHAFSKTGIQSYIIENTLPEIEEEINTLLYELTNGNISINFVVQKETKSKTMIDTLDIVVNDSNTSRKYETFSGGEKFRSDFACHVGMSRFLAKRASANIDLFILDENLGSQDETAKQIFIQCISKLTKYFKKILIITHINDIKDAFDNKILVTKDKDGSHVIIK